MIKKIIFTVDGYESEPYEYDTSNEDWIRLRDEDWADWLYKITDTSWYELPHNVQCNNCMWTGFEEDLVMYNETSKVDNTTLEYFKGCPNCKTDNYLMDI